MLPSRLTLAPLQEELAVTGNDRACALAPLFWSTSLLHESRDRVLPTSAEKSKDEKRRPLLSRRSPVFLSEERSPASTAAVGDDACRMISLPELLPLWA